MNFERNDMFYETNAEKQARHSYRNAALCEVITMLGDQKQRKAWYERGIVWAGDFGSFSPDKFFKEFATDLEKLKEKS